MKLMKMLTTKGLKSEILEKIDIKKIWGRKC